VAHLLKKFTRVVISVLALGAGTQANAQDVLSNLPGFDFSRLPSPAKKELSNVLTDEFDSCGRPLTLLASIKKGDACKHTRRMVGLAASLTLEGSSANEVIVQLSKYNQTFGKPRANFKIDERTCAGAKDAKVTLVEGPVTFDGIQCAATARLAGRECVVTGDGVAAAVSELDVDMLQ
jgi:hypothetical protein